MDCDGTNLHRAGCHRRCNELGFEPPKELGKVVSHNRDDATSTASAVWLALSESHCKPSAAREGRFVGSYRIIRDFSIVLSTSAFPHVVSQGQNGLLAWIP